MGDRMLFMLQYVPAGLLYVSWIDLAGCRGLGSGYGSGRERERRGSGQGAARGLQIREISVVLMELGSEENPSSSTFSFSEEDHTLGNSLRYVLNQDPRVAFCGYSVPHPSENRINVRIQTTGDPAKDVLKDALQDLMLMCRHKLLELTASLTSRDDFCFFFKKLLLRARHLLHYLEVRLEVYFLVQRQHRTWARRTLVSRLEVVQLCRLWVSSLAQLLEHKVMHPLVHFLLEEWDQEDQVVQDMVDLVVLEVEEIQVLDLVGMVNTNPSNYILTCLFVS
ncbi:hypothetical protein KI387_023182 [Taxus chinensis]|uniref:DNA-directed RNA polymerases I and III subunit RPAC2 n=1 Tax=Taxus chinensis TaxID=29808 RepID=A0AA38LAM8_TAXCH|nr:hypothetical protein KI387_023182 [Taxus chinensis]